MTLGQIFEGATRKTVWTKRDGKVSKRVVAANSEVQPRTRIELVKEPKE